MKQKELTFLFCIIWALTLLYGEMFAYWLPSIFTCSWPHFKVQTKNDSYQNDYVKVAVITDPQLTDKTSLRLPEKSLAIKLLNFYIDLNMRRSFFSSILPFKPDVILFLGDYFDGGPELSDEEWKESFNRFEHIFGLDAQGKYEDKQVYFISGNHDIGYESLHNAKPKVIGRYEQTFGVRNCKFTIGKVDFIAVDAQILDGHPQKHLTFQVWEFVKNISVDNVIRPRVLLTHIPLYRPDGTYCGPDRSYPIINQAINRASGDITYQNYVSEKSSKSLLDTVKPKLILSGHDHDQCTITHQSKSGPVKELTLGTISIKQGNLYPSFMLLSVDNSTLRNASISEEPLLTHLCYLPKKLHIYIWYTVLFGITLLALLFWPISSTSFWHQCWNLAGRFKQLIASIVSRNETKGKDEDAKYEYEMMWDAEGSMHLIRKPLKASTSNSNERSLGERGNVIMRASKQQVYLFHRERAQFLLNMACTSANSLLQLKSSSSLQKPVLNLRRNIAAPHHSPGSFNLKGDGLIHKGFRHQSLRQFIHRSKVSVIRAVAIPLEPPPVESVEYRKELAHRYGFNQIGEPLPDTVTLKDVITSLPKKVFEIDDVKAWKTVLISATSYALGLLMISKAPWYLLPLAWAWTGTAVTGFFVIGHDCAHKSFSTNKLVEDIVGTLAFLPLIYPYEPWRFKHDKHHAKTNMLKEDTAWQPVWKDEFESNPLLRKAIINGYGPLRCWMSIAHWLVVHFNLSKFRPNEVKRVKISLACVFAFIAIGWPLIIYKTGIMGWIKFWLMPWLGYHFWMSTFTMVHHTAPHIPFKYSEEWNAAQAQLNGTVHCAYPQWIEILCHDINVHIPHHISPKIPSYNLRAAHKSLQENWGKYLNEASWNWRLMKTILTVCHVYDKEQNYVSFDEVAPEESGSIKFLKKVMPDYA